MRKIFPQKENIKILLKSIRVYDVLKLNFFTFYRKVAEASTSYGKPRLTNQRQGTSSGGKPSTTNFLPSFQQFVQQNRKIQYIRHVLTQ